MGKGNPEARQGASGVEPATPHVLHISGSRLSAQQHSCSWWRGITGLFRFGFCLFAGGSLCLSQRRERARKQQWRVQEHSPQITAALEVGMISRLFIVITVFFLCLVRNFIRNLCPNFSPSGPFFSFLRSTSSSLLLDGNPGSITLPFPLSLAIS